jgi:hypothetical protein
LTGAIERQPEVLRFPGSQDSLTLNPMILFEGTEAPTHLIAAIPQEHFTRRHMELRGLADIEPCRVNAVDRERVKAATAKEATVSRDDDRRASVWRRFLKRE